MRRAVTSWHAPGVKDSESERQLFYEALLNCFSWPKPEDILSSSENLGAAMSHVSEMVDSDAAIIRHRMDS